mmetsp:Transcript_127867/g.408851  ORF Transcript_127867/g.408851 Transcript_127867/m.408851 type:complete len:145 (+) Transcript_127867:41-475(+)
MATDPAASARQASMHALIPLPSGTRPLGCRGRDRGDSIDAHGAGREHMAAMYSGASSKHSITDPGGTSCLAQALVAASARAAHPAEDRPRFDELDIPLPTRASSRRPNVRRRRGGQSIGVDDGQSVGPDGACGMHLSGISGLPK